ncbi:unnamed protein product, partial [Rotaria sp. Silwood2]
MYVPSNYSLPIDPNVLCDCERSYDCVYPSGFFNNWTLEPPFYYLIPDSPPVFFVPGILAGCIPRYSISQSTIECFYNSTCLDQIQVLMGDISSRRSLNTTNPSRFSPNTTIDSMFVELFIEAWHNTTNFTGYFNTCNPKLCSYTYTQRFYVVYVFVTLFSLISGLTVVLRFLAKFLVQHIFRRVQSICCKHLIDRHQVPAANHERS